ncbi:hypothetical protein ACORG1_22945 [Mycobacterium sp. TJFP1]
MTSAGKALAAKYAEALARASRENGRQLEWSETEATALRLAIESADGAERIKALLDAELAAPQPNLHIVTKLSAEWRLLNKAQMDYEWRLNPGLGQAKDPAKVRAGHARWAREPARGA